MPASVSAAWSRRATVRLGASGLATALTAAERQRAVAQAATPVGTVAGVPWAPGVLAEVLVSVPSAQFPGQTIYLVRLTFLPGSELPPHRHPGTTVLAVTAGTFSWTLVSGTAHLIRFANSPQPGRGEVRMSMELLLDVGDAVAFEDDVVYSARNPGKEPAVILATLILASDQPLLLPPGASGAGTPVGTPTA